MLNQPKDREWFVEVFNRYYDYIRNYLYYLSGDMNWSEDLVQDVFLQLWEKRRIVRDETIKPFLFTMARNFFLKDIRKKKYALTFSKSLDDFTDYESPEFTLEMQEFEKKLHQSVSKLPEKCRTIFLMNRIDKLTYKQIAENLSVTEKAIEKQMSRALSLLRISLNRNI